MPRLFRYRAEFVTELAAMPRNRRTAYAAATLGSAPALARELRRSDHRPVLCRLGVHRTVRTHNPQDMTILSKTCRRCGHVKDISRYLTRGNADGVAYGNVSLSGGH